MSGEVLTAVLSTVLHEPLKAHTLVGKLQQIRFKTLARLLHLRIAAMQTPSAQETCLRMIEEISETEAARLLQAPALCEQVRRGDDEGAIVALLSATVSAGSTAPIDVWSALGDCWLGHRPPPGYPGLIPRLQRYWSPVLACGVPLDLSLGAFVSVPSAGLRHAELLTEDELAATVPRLNEALTLVAEAYPLGYAIFAGLVANVLVRREAARVRECWGASSGIAVGRVVVINPASQPDARMLGEILLHEATHCALDCAELKTPLWRVEGSVAIMEDRTVVSPWTSNRLTPHAFLHATIVWAVLWHYWQRCEQHFGADAVSRARRTFISRGFDHMDADQRIATAMECLSPSAFDTLSAARTAVQAAA